MTVAMMSRFCRVMKCGRRTLRPSLLHYRNHSHDLQATASCQSVTAFVVLAHSRESSSMICQICDPRARLRLSPGIPWHRDTDPSNRYPPSYKHQILPTLMTCGDSGCIIGSEHGVAIAHPAQICRLRCGIKKQRRHHQKMMRTSPICIKVGVQDQFSTTL